MAGIQRVIADLRYLFYAVPLFCLLHLRRNVGRLVRRTYRTPDGKDCLMSLLTEELPQHRRIDSIKSLARYFGGDREAARYQPARCIVRLWDGQICSGVRARYGDCRELTIETVVEVLDEVIAERSKLREGRLPFNGCAAELRPRMPRWDPRLREAPVTSAGRAGATPKRRRVSDRQAMWTESRN